MSNKRISKYNMNITDTNSLIHIGTIPLRIQYTKPVKSCQFEAKPAASR